MTNIVAFEGFSDASIRVTPDGRYSVYDVIKLCTGSKNPRQAWKDLSARFPELSDLVSSHQFPGRGQQVTPVIAAKDLPHLADLLGSDLIDKSKKVTSDKFYPRTETQIVAVLVAAFEDQQPVTQFSVHGYRIDLYLASSNIAIEVDEYGHSAYCSKAEAKRERLIHSALGCSFVRFDPYAADFNLGVVVRKIRALIG